MPCKQQNVKRLWNCITSSHVREQINSAVLPKRHGLRREDKSISLGEFKKKKKKDLLLLWTCQLLPVGRRDSAVLLAESEFTFEFIIYLFKYMVKYIYACRGISCACLRHQ